MASNETLGAVVVGTNFGLLTHVEAMRRAGIEVRALVGRDAERTGERAARAGIAVSATSLAEALALPGVDLVAITTPPHSRAQLTLEAIAAGKHVVCEKPFARTISEAEEMLAAARAAGVVHIVGHEHRFDAGQATAVQAVREGVIGEPRMLTHILELPLFASAGTEVPDWWADADQGGGWLGANGIHMVDLARTMLGDFSGVSGTLHTLSDHGWTADDSFSLHFRTKSGASGLIQSSISTVGPPLFATRVAGSRGTLWMEGQRVFVADAEGQRELEPAAALAHDAGSPRPEDVLRTTYDILCGMADTIGPYTCLYETCRDRILGAEPANPTLPATFEDGVAGQRVLDAVRRSDREGGWVDVA